MSALHSDIDDAGLSEVQGEEAAAFNNPGMLHVDKGVMGQQPYKVAATILLSTC